MITKQLHPFRIYHQYISTYIEFHAGNEHPHGDIIVKIHQQYLYYKKSQKIIFHHYQYHDQISFSQLCITTLHVKYVHLYSWERFLTFMSSNTVQNIKTPNHKVNS